jgi:hypothetical protein
MSLAATISRLLDALYLPIIRRFVPPQIFRYGACGATNMALDAMLAENGDDLELFCSIPAEEGYFFKFFREYPEVL